MFHNYNEKYQIVLIINNKSKYSNLISKIVGAYQSSHVSVVFIFGDTTSESDSYVTYKLESKNFKMKRDMAIEV